MAIRINGQQIKLLDSLPAVDEDEIDLDVSELGFFGATPVSQQTDVGALTVADGAGTNDNEIGAITADASVIAAVQELASQINEIRTALRNLGLMA